MIPDKSLDISQNFDLHSETNAALKAVFLEEIVMLKVKLPIMSNKVVYNANIYQYMKMYAR